MTEEITMLTKHVHVFSYSVIVDCCLFFYCFLKKNLRKESNLYRIYTLNVNTQHIKSITGTELVGIDFLIADRKSRYRTPYRDPI